MSSAARREANRWNARQSTGPTSREGKTRSAHNARRHGLSLPVSKDPSLNARAEALARLIAGESAGGRRLDAARRVAEAEIDILRARIVRGLLLRNAIENVDYEPPEVQKSRNSLLFGALEMVLTDNAPRKNSLLAQKITELGADGQGFASRWLLPQRLSEGDRIAAIIGELAGKLTTLGRYERRAMSRRKFAIREFDQIKDV